MSAFDRRLKAHAAKFVARWCGTDDDDPFFFRVEGFVVNVFRIGCNGAKEYDWTIAHPDIWSRSREPHASLELAMYDVWAALVESMRAVHAVDMPELTPARDAKARVLLHGAFKEFLEAPRQIQ